MTIKRWLLLARRWLLRHGVPEWYWPPSIVLDGVEVPIRHTPMSFGTRRLLCSGQYEAEERALLRQLVQPGWQVIELGSSAGIVTATLAHGVGRQGRVLAVEAASGLAAFGQQWLARYPQATVVQGFAFPVGHAPPIAVNHFDETDGSLGGKLHYAVQQNPQVPHHQPVWDLNALCSQFQLQPQLLVVDIEASETLLLQCPPALPVSLQHVVMELHPGLYAEGKQTERQIIDALAYEGFTLRQRMADVCWFSREEAAGRM